LCDLAFAHVGKSGLSIQQAKNLDIGVILVTLSDAPSVISQLKDNFVQKDTHIVLLKLKYDAEAPFIKKNSLLVFNDEARYVYVNGDVEFGKYLFNNTKVAFAPIEFMEKDIKEVLTENIMYRGMIVSQKGNDLSSMGNVVKTLLPRFKDKRVLIIAENESKSRELETLLGKLDKVYIEEGSAVNKLLTANIKYDVVIEYPFINETFFTDRRALVDNSRLTGLFITLFHNENLIAINDINLHNRYQVKITNLLSDKELFPEEKWENSKMLQKIINLHNETKTEGDDKNFLAFYEKYKSNEALMKQICYIFYKQNYNKIITQSNENISLLTGEPGYRTFLASCISSKQKEE
jgi:hypothetical protein